MNLIVKEGKDNLDETMEEVNAAVQEAAKASLKDIRLMEEGRCPSCGHKTQQFLFTSVCASCGWFSFISPEEGKSIIHLKAGAAIECGTTFDTHGGYILGITDGVVRAKVSTDNVEHIEFVWSDEEIAKKRKVIAQEQAGVRVADAGLTGLTHSGTQASTRAAEQRHQDASSNSRQQCAGV